MNIWLTFSDDNLAFTVKRRRLLDERHNFSPYFTAHEGVHLKTSVKQVCCTIHEGDYDPNGV